MPPKVPILSTIKAFVLTKGLKVVKEDENGVMMIFGAQGVNDRVENTALVISGRDKQQDISVKAMCCLWAPESKRRQLLEYFARANLGLTQYVLVLCCFVCN